MKKSYIIPVFIGSMLLGSCVKDYECDIVVDKPQSVEVAQQLATLDVLNSYVAHQTNPNFTLALNVNSADYAAQALTYSIAKSNFDAVIDGSALLYGQTVADDGTYTYTGLTDMFIDNAPSVLGGTLLSYNTLNVVQLNQVVSANYVKGDLEMGKMPLADFDSDPVGTVYEMTNGSIATVVEDPAGESGNVLMIGSEDNKAKNSYPVINITLPDGLTLGDIQTIVFDIYCVDANSQKKNLVLMLNNQRKNYTGDTPEKRGCPLEQWARKIIELNVDDVDKLTEEDRALTSFPLSLGPNVLNSYYYIDNITCTWQTGEPDKYVEKTEAEKAQALADNFDTWAAALMKVAAPSVNEFVVVANPMSDDDAYMLRNAENEAELGLDTENSFFFNDYMGDDYMTKVTSALKSAYAEAGGQKSLKLYVKESNLLGNPGKVSRLLQQIADWRAAGAQIDGLAIELPLAYSTDAAEQAANEAAVKELFESVGGTDLIIRLDNVSMSNANASYYGHVIELYFANIANSKRGGIVFDNVNDLWKDATRTPVYKAVADALSKNF